MFEWSFYYFLIVTFIIATGSMLQAATGMGAGFIVVPLLALISIHLVPGPTMFASLVLTITMAYRGRHDIDYKNFGILILGILIGIFIAVSFLSHLKVESLKLVFGILILFVVAISLCTKKFKITMSRLFLAGNLAGFLGTTAGFGAPVLALFFQHQRIAVVRATLALVYVLSALMMLIALHFLGRFSKPEVLSGLMLTPGFIIGYLISPRLAQFVDQGFARVAILSISSMAAFLLIAQSLDLF